MKQKTLWNVGLTAAAVAVGLALSAKPWQYYREQKKLAEAATQEMREAESKRTELVRQKAKYESALGREELARKQGYRRPDEQPLGE